MFKGITQSSRFAARAGRRSAQQQAVRPTRNIKLYSTQATIQPVPKKDSKIKVLMKKYGVSALVVYMLISAIDLSACFYGVHQLGELKMNIMINDFKNVIGMQSKSVKEIENEYLQKKSQLEKSENEIIHDTHTNVFAENWEKIKNSHLFKEFLIAYGLHKLLIVMRIPLTAAITPRFVKTMAKFGIDMNKSRKVLITNSVNNNNNVKSSTKKWFGLF